MITLIKIGKNILLLIVISLICLLFSCKESNNENPQSSNYQSDIKPVESNMGGEITSNTILPDAFPKVDSLNIYYPAYIPMRYTFRTEWREYIFDKFGIDITISYDGYSLNDISRGEFPVETLIYLGFTNYFTYQLNTEIYDYCNDELFYDLSPYYLKYGWDKVIDEEYLGRLVTNGRIYAVPAVGNPYIVPRRYNKEYLGAVGMTVPENTAEFLDYLRAVKSILDEDGNYYPMSVDFQRFTPSTSDIFRAFGCYVNSQNNSTISFDPGTGSFEDAVFSENFDQALSYIRNLRQEKLLFIDGYSGTTMIDNGLNFYDGDFSFAKDLATEYWYIYDIPSGFFLHESYDFKVRYDVMNGYYLDGINHDNLCEVRRDMAFYVFPKAIENIYGTIELFNDLFTNPLAYGDLKYGRQGYEYEINGDEIIPLEPVAGAYLNLLQISGFCGNDQTYYPESTQYIQLLSKDIWFEKNVFTEHSAYHDASSDEPHFGYGNTFILDSLFNENLSIADSMAQYMIEFKESERLGFLESMNEALGVPTKYDYTPD
ncbi:MAG: hypothetical protein JXN10_05150 [Clostridia bacterium]|nr:hypothetical protein [Clostridia bacterium]MBN2882893.1 hypothetical protein [Clostridia bacterium]